MRGNIRRVLAGILGVTVLTGAISAAVFAEKTQEVLQTDDEMTHYLMVHFVGKDPGLGVPNGNKYDQEAIYFSVSDDGVEWKMLNNMDPIFR